MFVGRENEMKQLNKFYNRDSFQLLALYGRRRVGKTELLKRFSKDKYCLFFSAEEATDILNLRKASEQYENLIGTKIGTLNTWEDFFEGLAKLSEDKRIILIIDEFPYLQASYSGFLSKFQHIIDHLLLDTNMMVVLSGSSISFMEDEVFSQKSPLFGRLSGQLFLKPFDYIDAGKMFEDYSNIEKLESYFILGGIPQYLKEFSTSKTVKDNIIDSILDSTEALYHAPNNLIRQELRSPAVYNSILEVVSEGASKSNEINTKIGVSQSVGQNYMTTLVNLHMLDKKKPIGEATKRKTIYRVSDFLFDFIYKFAYRYRSPIELGMGELVFEQHIKDQLPAHYGKKFEIVCLQYLNKLNSIGKLPILFEEMGTWWGSNPQSKRAEEIDIVGLNKTFGLYAECKYRNEKVGKNVLDSLKAKSMLIPRLEMCYFLFSKSGFTKELIEYANQHKEVNLVTISDLFG